MDIIRNKFYEGERPLYAAQDLRLEQVKFYPGESALKEAKRIHADNCYFMGKYPFWHNQDSLIRNSLFTVYSRAAIWYSKNIRMYDTLVEAPKMFREIDGLYLENVKLSNAGETLWNCRNIEMKNVEAFEAPYILMNSEQIEIDGLHLRGDYSFQDAKNVVVRNAYIDSKDAFWKTENVTVYDSMVVGEYLGWHSKNLKFVNCTIGGTQPLCYAENLVLENCKFLDDCDLAFEYSSVQVEVTNHIVSIKNPLRGTIKAQSIGEIIEDQHCRIPGACSITVSNEFISAT